MPDDKQIGADSVRHAAVLLGLVAMGQMHLQQKAAAAELHRTFDQRAPNLVALELRQARRRPTLAQRLAPRGRRGGLP